MKRQFNWVLVGLIFASIKISITAKTSLKMLVGLKQGCGTYSLSRVT